MYSGEATRPLSLANTDNKVMAGASRICLEPVADDWISWQQRGFVGGRKMSRNVVELDLEARCSAMRGERSALVFFDFKTAFPSISQDYLLHCLGALGLCDSWLVAIRRFYTGNWQIVRLGRSSDHWFLALVGSGRAVPSPRSSLPWRRMSCYVALPRGCLDALSGPSRMISAC